MSALRFWLLLLVAAALSALPLIGLPLRWAGTFFHEFSHGLMAAATGGDIVRIVLRTDGSGLCVFTGGWGVPVAFAGYAGAPLWGLGIFALASGDSQRDDAPILAGLLGGTVAITALLYARDAVTIVISALLVALLLLPLRRRWRNGRALQAGLEVLGLAVMLDAVQAPLALFGLSGRHDGADLAAHTWLPAPLWAGLWCVLAGACLWLAWRRVRALR